MTDNDLFYVCSLVEYTSRSTKNRHRVIAKALGPDGFRKQLKDAPVNHCLPFEQVSAELTADYGLTGGDFDAVGHAKYSVPGYLDMGKLYAILIERVANGKNIADTAYELFSSFLCDELSDFNTDLYYQNPDYLAHCYLAGKIL